MAKHDKHLLIYHPSFIQIQKLSSFSLGNVISPKNVRIDTFDIIEVIVLAGKQTGAHTNAMKHISLTMHGWTEVISNILIGIAARET
jgi:hypothetical protein